MDIQQILKVLKNERECIARQSGVEAPDGSVGICDRNCAKCDLCLPDDEILEVYDFLINGYELTAIPITISREQADTLLELLKKSSLSVYPMPDKASYPTITVITPDEYGREHFNGICPYTNKKCDTWTCGICEVAERERKFAEGDTDK